MGIIDEVKTRVQGTLQGVMGKAVALAPDSWIPGGTPDPLLHQYGHVGRPVSRIDGRSRSAARRASPPSFRWRT
ncbi:hypothetical protein J2X65_004699 [Ancylobacter sp. 3268]|uniref:hypothetical protein n=1 Tax=Ancylobacter sp. 3268 TaxID=2817752 RepID=UPI00285E2792|nr:hypothetical protein [Ancylobacter sp. 3268]MDR6955320.1 hypothetical protein [Ancylobacter sp. 3268]